ncbi:alpha/beta hydrolase [Actinoplanes sp. NPDC051475]|uniref:alpha/beta fold hydrolase n=1 Tax=Actinoplanes sp. NPDC051475 TaxID=3157225 RepID=UPI00344B1F47
MPFDDEGWALFDGAARNPANLKAIIDLTTGNRLSSYWLDTMVRRSLEESTVEAFGAYLPAWARTDFSASVQGNPVPALAVVGEHDPALGAGTMRATWMATYPNARLEVLADAGHYAMDETPIRLATILEQFLASPVCRGRFWPPHFRAADVVADRSTGRIPPWVVRRRRSHCW